MVSLAHKRQDRTHRRDCSTKSRGENKHMTKALRRHSLPVQLAISFVLLASQPAYAGRIDGPLTRRALVARLASVRPGNVGHLRWQINVGDVADAIRAAKRDAARDTATGPFAKTQMIVSQAKEPTARGLTGKTSQSWDPSGKDTPAGTARAEMAGPRPVMVDMTLFQLQKKAWETMDRMATAYSKGDVDAAGDALKELLDNYTDQMLYMLTGGRPPPYHRVLVLMCRKDAKLTDALASLPPAELDAIAAALEELPVVLGPAMEKEVLRVLAEHGVKYLPA